MERNKARVSFVDSMPTLGFSNFTRHSLRVCPFYFLIVLLRVSITI